MAGNIIPYESQVSDVSGIPNTRASGDDFGAQVGRAAQGVGAGIANLGEALQQHLERNDSVDGQLVVAKAHQDMARDLVKAQNSPDAGSPDFTSKFAQHFDEYQTKAAAGLPNNPKVQGAFKVAMANLKTSLTDQAMQNQASQAAQLTTLKAQQTLATYANTVQTDPSQYAASIKAGTQLIDTLGLPPVDATKLRENFINTTVAGRFDALFRAAKTPQEVQGIVNDIENGPWKSQINTQHYDDLLRVGKAAVTSAQKTVNEQATAAVSGVEDRIKGGAAIDPAEMASVGTAVKQSNNPVLVDKWTRLQVQADTTQRVNGLATPALRDYVTSNKTGNVPDVGPNTTTGRAQDGYSYLQSKYGLDASAALGVLANVGRETAFNPRPGDNGTSDGYFQWHKGDDFDRLGPARAAGATGTDIKRAIDYAMSEPWGRQFLQNAANGEYKTPQQAAQAWMTLFERPANPGRDAGVNAAWVERLTHVVNGGRPLASGVTSDAAANGGPPAVPTGAPTEYEWIRGKAANDVLKRREQLVNSGNQMQAAADAGAVTVGPLNEASDFQARAQASRVAQGFLGAKDNKPFTPDEVSSFTQVMSGGSLEQKLALLQNVAGMGQVAPAAFKQIGEKLPVFEHIGGLNGVSPNVAQEVLRGSQAMQENPDLKTQLESKDTGSGGTQQAFTSVIGDSLAGMPHDAYGARLAADALYLQRVGPGAAWNADTYGQAVRDVLGGKQGDAGGGVVTINGSTTVLPPGVNGDQFSTMVHALTPQDLVEHSIGGGPPVDIQKRPIAPQDIATEGKFRAIGNGVYNVFMADGHPALGTGPNGFYAFRIDAGGVADILKRTPPETQPSWLASHLPSSVADQMKGLPPLSNVNKPGNASDRFLQSIFGSASPTPDQLAPDASMSINDALMQAGSTPAAPYQPAPAMSHETGGSAATYVPDVYLGAGMADKKQ